MAFTDRFIKFPIQVFDKKLKDVIGTTDGEDSWMKVNPMEIASYRPNVDSDDPQQNEIVSMTLKSGDNYLVYMSVDEFENRLNNYSK